MKIVFLIGAVQIGGGNYVVVQHALEAAAQGHDVTILSMYRFSPQDLAWHPGFSKLKVGHLNDAEGQQFDIAIATWWKTALELPKVAADQYAYFVQSIESRFYDDPEDAMRRLVDRTYELRLPGITEATWIQAYLQQTYGSAYHLARNGIRKDLYSPSGDSAAPRVPGKLRVLVEGSLKAPKIKNTARTVRAVNRGKPFETWMLTSTKLPWYPGVDRLFTSVPIDQVARIYRSCDVIVKLSFIEGMFGPPLEMFHCGGTAIVYNVSGHDEYIRHGSNALIAKMHDEAQVVAHLKQLRDEPELLRTLKAGALDTAAQWPSWPDASRLFLEHVHALCDAPRVSRDVLTQQVLQIRTEFANELGPVSAPNQPPPPSKLSRAGLQGAQRAIQSATTFMGYIADGYR